MRSLRLFLHASIMLLLALSGALMLQESDIVQRAEALPSKAEIIDVSNHQGDINWQKVRRSGVWGSYLKLSEGQDYTDPLTGPRRLEAMRQAGVRYGFYHFLRPKKRDAALEARHFIRQAQALGGWGDFWPVADIEVTKLGPARTAQYLQRFLRVLRQEGGVRRTVVYASPGWWRSHVRLTDGLRAELGYSRAWVAHWGKKEPDLLSGFRSWALHQYTESGRVPGIKGPVDRNRTSKLAMLVRRK